MKTDTKPKIIRRLKIIQGQVRGLQEMVEKGACGMGMYPFEVEFQGSLFLPVSAYNCGNTWSVTTVV